MTRDTAGKTFVARLCLLGLVLLIASCATPAREFRVSKQNMEAVREAPANLTLGSFTGSIDRVGCRAESISAGKDATFASYIRDAFAKVIQTSKVTDKESTIELSGSLKEIELDCAYSNTGTWNIEMDFAVDGKEPFSIRVVQLFNGHIVAVNVFQNALEGLILAVQKIVDDVLESEQIQTAAR